jgi:nitroreductase
MIELLRQRRSVRKFTAEKVSQRHREQLVEAALRSPSSRGINPWEFIFVDDPERIEALAASKQHGATLLRGAPLAVVVCADETKADTWVEDCSIASILLQLTAQELGLGSCWVQIRLRTRADGEGSETYVQRLLGIPENVRIVSIIAIGHPAESKPGHPAENLDRSRIHANQFGS